MASPLRYRREHDRSAAEKVPKRQYPQLVSVHSGHADRATWSAVQAANKPTAPDSARSGDSEPDVAFDTAHSGPPLTSRSMAVDSACSVALDAASLRGPPADECSVCVAVHVRPLIQQEVDAGAVYSLPVTLGEPQVSAPTANGPRTYRYDHIFGGDRGQPSGQLFHTCVEPLVEGLFQGYNATVLAYGQTGSGKTHTMMGSGDPSAGGGADGVIPRVMDAIFDHISRTRGVVFNVRVGFVELYMEEIKDLLASGSGPHPEVVIREDGGNIFLQGATVQEVRSKEQMAMALKYGAQRRVTGATAMNHRSSRSHAIFTITLEQRKLPARPAAPSRQNSGISLSTTSWVADGCMLEDFEEGPDMGGLVDSFLCAKMHLIDLAGSERLKKTKAEGQRMQEGIDINRGLLSLGNVITALSERKVHVPYRESKLTRMLQDSLGGNSRTVMIACVSPAGIHSEETLNTLRYASRARKIRNCPKVNRDPVAVLITELQQQLAEAKNENQALRNRLDMLQDAEAMASTMEELEQCNHELEGECHRLQTEAESLRDSLAQAAGRVIVVEAEWASLTQRLAHSSEACAELGSQNAALEQQVATLQQQVRALESIVESLRSQLISAGQQSCKAQEQLSLVREDSSASCHAIQAEWSVAELRRQVRRLELQLLAAEGSVGGAASAAQQLAQDLAAAEERAAALELSLQERTAQLQERTSQLAEAAKQAQRDLAAQHGKASKVQRELVGERNRADAVEQRLADASRRLGQLEEDLGSERVRAVRLERDLGYERGRADVAERGMADAARLAEQFQLDLGKERRKAEQLLLELCGERERGDAAEQAAADADRRAARLQAELRAEQEKVDSVQRQLGAERGRATQLEQALNAELGRAEAAEAELEAAREEVRRLEAQLGALRKQAVAMEGGLVGSTTAMQELQRELAAAEDRGAAAERALQGRLAALKERLAAERRRAEQAEQALDGAKQSAEQLEAELGSERVRATRMERDASAERSRAEHAECQLASAVLQLTKLELALAAAAEAREAAEEHHLEALQRLGQQRDDDVAAAAECLDVAARKAYELQSELDAAREAMEGLEGEVLQLRMQLATQKLESGGLRSQLASQAQAAAEHEQQLLRAQAEAVAQWDTEASAADQLVQALQQQLMDARRVQQQLMEAVTRSAETELRLGAEVHALHAELAAEKEARVAAEARVSTVQQFMVGKLQALRELQAVEESEAQQDLLLAVWHGEQEEHSPEVEVQQQQEEEGGLLTPHEYSSEWSVSAC